MSLALRNMINYIIYYIYNIIYQYIADIYATPLADLLATQRQNGPLLSCVFIKGAEKICGQMQESFEAFKTIGKGKYNISPKL